MRVTEFSRLMFGVHPALRLSVSIAFGWAIFLLLPDDWGIAKRGATGWIAMVGMFLSLLSFAVGGASADRLRARARVNDPSLWAIQILVILAAIASLVEVGALLGKEPSETASGLALRIALAGGVVVGSWLLINFVFAVHYMHGYYGDRPARGVDAGGLLFPGDDLTPDFWDFVYFSLVIGMTCQVSDVQITRKHTRRVAALHGVLSFFFNTVILALTVNFLVNAL
ncbi:MAG TPA: DUF1345 domain-containing protein [Stellaceae bacterium]|nr:DUF1345 domain-containing protein [Stellaceae bacterium]